MYKVLEQRSELFFKRFAEIKGPTPLEVEADRVIDLLLNELHNSNINEKPSPVEEQYATELLEQAFGDQEVHQCIDDIETEESLKKGRVTMKEFDKAMDDSFDSLDEQVSRHEEYKEIEYPSHYTQGKIQSIQYINDQNFPPCLAAASKYIHRCRFKGQEVKDVKKAIQYLKIYIELISD